MTRNVQFFTVFFLLEKISILEYIFENKITIYSNENAFNTNRRLNKKTENENLKDRK